jgi:hypothetical protein
MKEIEKKESIKNNNKQKENELINENNKRNILNKYGQNYGQHINKGEVIIGMNKSMCKDAWKSLYKVVQQTNTDKGLIEVWEHNFYKIRIYFQNGIVYKIQTW